MTSTKTFHFKEETFKCELHCQLIIYICLCKHKLCHKCLVEGLHLNSHNNVKIVPIKELKRVYMNEIDDLDDLLNELCEGKFKTPLTNFTITDDFLLKEMAELKHFSEKLISQVNFVQSNFLNEIFNEEKEIIKELKNQIDDVGIKRKLLDTEEIIDLVDKIKFIKEKSKLCQIRKYEKINLLQNNFLNKNEEFLEEFNILLKRFFYGLIVNDNSYESHVKVKSSMSNVINSNLNKIMNDEDNLSKLSSTGNDNKYKFSSFQNSNKKNINVEEITNLEINSNIFKYCGEKSHKGRKEIKNYSNFSNLSNSSKKSKNSKKKLINSFSLWNEEIIQELTPNLSKCSLSYEKKLIFEKNTKNNYDCNFSYDELEKEKYSNFDNFDYEDDIVNDKKINNEILDMENDDDSIDISYEKKINFKELTPLENRNRITNILKFKNKTIYENFNTGKNNYHNYNKKCYNGFQNSIQNNKNYKNNKKMTNNNLFNNNTPINNNQKNSIAKSSSQICMECMIIYTVTKTNPHWKKKCLECQKFNQNKTNKFPKVTHNNIDNNSHIPYNNYKSGKTTKICGNCKNSFIVPVSLLDQRKTCYYCFKSNNVKTNTNLNSNKIVNNSDSSL